MEIIGRSEAFLPSTYFFNSFASFVFQAEEMGAIKKILHLSYNAFSLCYELKLWVFLNYHCFPVTIKNYGMQISHPNSRATL